MNEELEELWRLTVAEAQIKARNAGEKDIDNYLALKSANDEIRRTACDLLFRLFLEIAHQANQKKELLKIENLENHRFELRGATMRGSLVRLRQGIRTLTVEAGFPRFPTDGFVRGNGLATARIIHFGFPKYNNELVLARFGADSPRWFIVETETSRIEFNRVHLGNHFKNFLEL